VHRLGASVTDWGALFAASLYFRVDSEVVDSSPTRPDSTTPTFFFINSNHQPAYIKRKYLSAHDVKPIFPQLQTPHNFKFNATSNSTQPSTPNPHSHPTQLVPFVLPVPPCDSENKPKKQTNEKPNRIKPDPKPTVYQTNKRTRSLSLDECLLEHDTYL
jgi:hypothetical protein